MGLQSKMSEWVSGFEEKEGVMRNAMTTRAPCGANNISPSIVVDVRQICSGIELSGSIQNQSKFSAALII